MAIDQHQTSLGLEETGTNQATDAERDRERAEYRARLAEKLKDPEFRKIEGFPVGTDEAILALSDPPHFTACPNPFIDEWLAEHATPYDPATDDYFRAPFAADVSEGKNDPIYNAHAYHTKVPHKAIMNYILHYTKPGDVVYDGFCGTGMTGVAAQLCGNRTHVESLGFRARPDGSVVDREGVAFSRMGVRTALLNDLSPAAAFIAYNYNTPVRLESFEREARDIIKAVEDEYGWMYSTLHNASPSELARVTAAIRACKSAHECRELYGVLRSPGSPLRDASSQLQVGRVNYSVWSESVICPACLNEVTIWEGTVDESSRSIRDHVLCKECRSQSDKAKCDKATVTYYDQELSQSVTQAKQTPVLLNYTVGGKRYEKKADDHDLVILRVISDLAIEHPVPVEPMLGKGERWGDTWRAGYHLGISHAHHFFTRRSLNIVSALWDRAVTPALHAAILGGFSVGLRMSRFRTALWFDKSSGPMKGMTAGTMYVPPISGEQNWLNILEARAEAIARQLRSASTMRQGSVALGIASTSCQRYIADNSVDYIFTDPPFGDVHQYSELNFLSEAWLRVKTASAHEAITSQSQKKGLREYQGIMQQSFSECCRVLKPGRWMTLKFHNSSNAVWNSIQEALQVSGFIVADSRVLDTKQGSFLQVTSASVVKHDLVISCYKPRHEFEQRFQHLQGQVEGAIEFVRQHLEMVPVAPVNRSGRLEPVAERTRYILFDRMIAYHLKHGARIPVSAAEFYKVLEEQFLERDEMYFLPEQAARYDALKARGVEIEQFSLFVRDERSAVQWVRTRLTETPQTLGDLTPTFLQELREWPAHEPRPELRDLLREYFIEDGGIWRVPDPDNERDLEALRRAALLKMFREYAAAKGPLKTFRTEAVLEGFRYCWETKQYGIVVQVCEKIPAKVLQEVHDLVQFYDIAKDLAPERVEQLEFTWE